MEQAQTTTHWRPWADGSMPEHDRAVMVVVDAGSRRSIVVGSVCEKVTVLGDRFSWDYTKIHCWTYADELITLPLITDSQASWKKEYDSIEVKQE